MVSTGGSLTAPLHVPKSSSICASALQAERRALEENAETEGAGPVFIRDEPLPLSPETPRPAVRQPEAVLPPLPAAVSLSVAVQSHRGGGKLVAKYGLQMHGVTL